MNTAEINNLKDNFVAQFELEDEAKNIIKLFFPEVNEFYVAVKNVMPRVTIWEKG